MSIIIKGMEMPKSCSCCRFEVDETDYCLGYYCTVTRNRTDSYRKVRPRNDCPLAPVPPHGRLIDADALRQSMYHEAFETDSPMQKWDSGCWIRYKMFERMEETAPTIIEEER